MDQEKFESGGHAIPEFVSGTNSDATTINLPPQEADTQHVEQESTSPTDSHVENGSVIPLVFMGASVPIAIATGILMNNPRQGSVIGLGIGMMTLIFSD